MRVQLIIALVAGLILIAVPLYLWRRPSASNGAQAAAVASSAPVDAGPAPVTTESLIAAALDGGVKTDEVGIERVWIDNCQPQRRGGINEPCDRQPFFEEALVKAVLENTVCAPQLNKSGSISFALRIDYGKKKVSLFAGKSGTMPRKQAREVVKCVERAMPTPEWDAQAHQHSRYVIAVLATYPAVKKQEP